MNRNLWLFIMLFFSVSAFAQKASLRGVLIDFETKAPVAGVKVYFQKFIFRSRRTFSRFGRLPALPAEYSDWQG